MIECRTKDGFGRSKLGWLYTEEEWKALRLLPVWSDLRDCEEEGEREGEHAAETPLPVPTLPSPDSEADLEREYLVQAKTLNELFDHQVNRVESAESVGTGSRPIDRRARIRAIERRRTIYLEGLERWYQRKRDYLKLWHERKRDDLKLWQEANRVERLQAEDERNASTSGLKGPGES